MPLMSTTMRALVGTARRPSISARLRFGPKPRSEMDAIPTELTAEICTSVLPPEPPFTVGEAAGLNAGSWFRYDSMFRPDLLSSTVLSTVTSGLLATKSRRTMREPVTCTSSSSSVSAAAAGMATANMATVPMAAATAARTRNDPVWA